MSSQSLFQGILCALGASLVWGSVFIVPLILSDYPPTMLAFGRYLAFGLICLPLAWRDRRRFAKLVKQNWLVRLPLSLLGMGTAGLWLARSSSFSFPFGPQPLLYLALMFTIGLLASRLGTLLWNKASSLLPTSLAGQLIVFETLSVLIYAFVLRGSLPTRPELAGLFLLVSGVILGVRAVQHSMPSYQHE